MTKRDDPGLADVIRVAVEAAQGKIRTSLPAIVLSYDQATQTAQVQVVIQSSHLDDDGERVFYLPEPISNCPVRWPSAGDFSLTFPIAAGSPCKLSVTDRSTGEWKSTTALDIVHEPADPRRFDLTDAFVEVGGRPPSQPLPAAAVDASAMVLRAPEIKLGSSSATQPLVLGDDLVTRMNALENAFSGHGHTYIPGTLPPVVTTLNPVFTPTTIGQIKSDVVKSE